MASKWRHVLKSLRQISQHRKATVNKAPYRLQRLANIPTASAISNEGVQSPPNLACCPVSGPCKRWSIRVLLLLDASPDPSRTFEGIPFATMIMTFLKLIQASLKLVGSVAHSMGTMSDRQRVNPLTDIQLLVVSFKGAAYSSARLATIKCSLSVRNVCLSAC